jgi:hypothetical protein
MYRIAGAVGLILFAGVVLLALPSQAFAQPPIPHPLEGRDDCLACHETEAGGGPQVPEDHAGRTNETCQGCHAEATEAAAGSAPFIPHTLEGRDNCVACHAPAPDGTELTAGAPAGPTIVPTPLAYPEPQGNANSCFDCHQTLSGRSEQIVNDWQESIHAERDVICADCHGGDPNAADMAESMSPEAGFIGKPDRTDIPDLCGACHADVNQMRQYDLPTDQLAKYQESFHGQRLAEGDTKVATCFDCHDGHATRETNNPSASVYHLNVPTLCAECHADNGYMAEYDLPTNQFALYQQSVHGVALLDNQDTRAPSCATCHGTHGAAPPGYSEVANVCGSCHNATQNYFLDGAHNSDNPEAPKCVTCHGRYDVGVPSEELLVGSQPRHCGSCHTSDSEAGEVVTEMYDALVEAGELLEEAEFAIDRAASLGMIVTEEENLVNDARTKLITARAAQHTVSLDVVLEESDAAAGLSEQARQLAEDSISESRFRRQAMVVAVVVIVLVIFSLVTLRRELTAGRH